MGHCGLLYGLGEVTQMAWVLAWGAGEHFLEDTALVALSTSCWAKAQRWAAVAWEALPSAHWGCPWSKP